MKVLVTGGTGFLGKQLAFKLQTLGYEVSILGRNSIIGEKLKEKGLKYCQADLKDTPSIMTACQGQDYIFHCGGLSSPWGKYQDFYNANVLGTRNVIQGCQTHGVKRLIHVSTSSVYFDFSHRLNISESQLFVKKPANAYAKSKQLAELEINTAHQLKLPVITIRPRAIFGAGDPSILPRLIKANQRTGIPLMNDGKVWIDVTYIDNVVDALLLCQSAPDSLLGSAFNISNGEPMYLDTLLEMLFKKLQHPYKAKRISYNTAYWAAAVMELVSTLSRKEPTLTRFTVGLLAKSQTLDITAAKEKLGYQPRVSVEEGLDIFAHWWKQVNP